MHCPFCSQPPTPGLWGSWLTWILPYVDQQDLFAKLDLTGDENKNCNGTTSPGATPLALYICPADYVPQQTVPYSGGLYFGVNSYFGNAGAEASVHGPTLDGVLFYNSSVTFDDLAGHGTTNTFLAEASRYSLDPGDTGSGFAKLARLGLDGLERVWRLSWQLTVSDQFNNCDASAAGQQ